MAHLQGLLPEGPVFRLLGFKLLKELHDTMSAVVKLPVLSHSGAEDPAGWKSLDDKSPHPSSAGSDIVAGGEGDRSGQGDGHSVLEPRGSPSPLLSKRGHLPFRAIWDAHRVEGDL